MICGFEFEMTDTRNPRLTITEQQAPAMPEGLITDAKLQTNAQRAAHRILESCSVVPDELRPQMHEFTSDAVDFIFGVAASHLGQVRDERTIRDESGDDTTPRLPNTRRLLETTSLSPVDRTAQVMLSILSEKRKTSFSTRNAELDNDYSLKVFPLAMAVGRYSVPVEVLRLEARENGATTYIIQENPLDQD